MILVLLLFVHYLANVKSDIALCAGRDAISQPVIDFCREQNATLELRCCFSSDFKTILAVDMLDMNLTVVPDFTQHANLNASVLDLRSNPQLVPSRDSDFVSLTTLDNLLLPDQFDCPGGTHVWQIINKTTDPLGNLCMKQKDFCVNTTNICIEPVSYCNVNGPNHFICLCKSGYHGYKCLRQGTFPMSAFIGTTVAVTVVASVLLYWTQRRHVQK